MLVDSFNYALYLSVCPSGIGFKFLTVDLKQHTFYRHIEEISSNGVCLFKDMSDRVMVLDSVGYLCVLIILVTAG